MPRARDKKGFLKADNLKRTRLFTFYLDKLKSCAIIPHSTFSFTLFHL